MVTAQLRAVTYSRILSSQNGSEATVIKMGIYPSYLQGITVLDVLNQLLLADMTYCTDSHLKFNPDHDFFPKLNQTMVTTFKTGVSYGC